MNGRQLAATVSQAGQMSRAGEMKKRVKAGVMKKQVKRGAVKRPRLVVLGKVPCQNRQAVFFLTPPLLSSWCLVMGVTVAAM